MSTIRSQIHRLTQSRDLVSARANLAAVEQISDSCLRVTIEGEGLSAYDDPRPADAFKLLLPPVGSPDYDEPVRDENGIPTWPDERRRPVLRAFTVRHFDPCTLRLSFDVVIHPGHTLGWLRDATPGEVVGISGMRVEFAEGDGIDEHVFVGDASALPAVSAILDSLAPSTRATVILACDHLTDRRLVRARRATDLTWVDGGSPSGERNALLAALQDRDRPEGRLQAWVCAEAGVTRGLRAHLLDAWRVDRADLHAAAYWKAGVDATTNDEQSLGRYLEVMASGADVFDPETRERVEFGPDRAAV